MNMLHMKEEFFLAYFQKNLKRLKDLSKQFGVLTSGVVFIIIANTCFRKKIVFQMLPASFNYCGCEFRPHNDILPSFSFCLPIDVTEMLSQNN